MSTLQGHHLYPFAHLSQLLCEVIQFVFPIARNSVNVYGLQVEQDGVQCPELTDSVVVVVVVA